MSGGCGLPQVGAYVLVRVYASTRCTNDFLYIIRKKIDMTIAEVFSHIRFLPKIQVFSSVDVFLMCFCLSSFYCSLMHIE